MHFINPFKGLRPIEEKASSVSIPSTDHLSQEVIVNHKKKNPWSYLNIFNPDLENLKYENEINAEAKRKFELMTKFKLLISLFIIIIFFSGCQTVKEKTDAIVEKENEKLSKFLGKSASELQMELGKPDEDFKNAKGNFELVYNSKKYLVPCERRFEINSENIVVGFVSNGCF